MIAAPRYVWRDDGAVTQSYYLPTETCLMIAAENVHREKTGIHAKLTISLATMLLAYSTFNVERDEDRVRLANSAMKHVPTVESKGWSAQDMKHALDLFTERLWDTVIGSFDAEEMAGEGGLVDQDFLCRPWVLKGAGTMLYAPPGRGKSFSGILMAVSMDAGCDALFDVAVPRKAMIINLERSRDSMARRLEQVNICLGLEPERPLLFLNARGRNLSDVLDAARKAIRERRVECVFLDSISRAGLGDLNENAPANKIIDALNGLCPTWFGLAHTPRQDESHIYGSVHFDAGIDIGVQMLSQSAQDGMTVGIGLKVTKANDIRRDNSIFTYALEFGEMGLSGVRKARAGDFPEMMAAGRPNDIESQAKEFLSHYGEATADEIAKEIGRHRSDVSRVLNAAKGFVRMRRGRQIFFGVQALEVVS